MQVIHPSDLLTAAELADRLRVKPGTILGWHQSGRIPGRRLSHKVLRFEPGRRSVRLGRPTKGCWPRGWSMIPAPEPEAARPALERLAYRLTETAAALGISRRTLERLRSGGRVSQARSSHRQVSFVDAAELLLRWIAEGGWPNGSS